MNGVHISWNYTNAKQVFPSAFTPIFNGDFQTKHTVMMFTFFFKEWVTPKQTFPFLKAYEIFVLKKDLKTIQENTKIIHSDLNIGHRRLTKVLTL